MRILHILESCAPGGIETTFLRLLRVMTALDPSIEHRVLAFAPGPLENPLRAVAADLCVAPEWRAMEAVTATAPEVVHILFERCAYALVPAIVAASDVPVVYAKGYDLGGMYRANEGFSWNADAALVAAASHATFTTGRLAECYGHATGEGRRATDDGYATVLGKAAEVARFASVPAAAPGAPPHVVCVANLHPRKRLPDLIDAVALARRPVPAISLSLVVAGGDAVRAELLAHAHRAGLAEVVSLAGHRVDVAPEIEAARVVALPSSCEGVPTVLLEAMAAGRLVVATRSGHVESIVTDGVEGCLVEVGDVAALARGLARLLLDRDTAARMGVAGRARAARHDVSRIAADVLRVLRRAGSRARAGVFALGAA
jgi:glycosyltransferase involved in cell wall biosynthesis